MDLFGNKEMRQMVYKHDQNITELYLINDDMKRNNLKNSELIKGINEDIFKNAKGIHEQGRLISELHEENVSLKIKQDEIMKLVLQIKEEQQIEKHMKVANSSLMTCKDIATELKCEFKNLDETVFKYYLYEKGLLNLNFGRDRNTYFLKVEKEISDNPLYSFLHKQKSKSGKIVFVFSREILSYIRDDSEFFKKSIATFIDKNKQYRKSKRRLTTLQVENYRNEINKYCGTGDSFNAHRWGLLYSRYSVDHKDWQKKYNVWREKMIKENPKCKNKFTKIYYLVEICNDGDVLLKIAIELFG